MGHNHSHELAPDDIAPRDSETCVIADLLRYNLDDFLTQASEGSDSGPLPGFVERELRAISQCGDFVRG